MSTIIDKQISKTKTLKTVENNEKKEKCEQCIRLKSQIEDLSDEIISLKEINKELYDIDKRRQSYDIERQDYIIRLLQTIKKLQLRSSQLISSDSDNDCRTERQQSFLINSTKRQAEDNQKNEKSLLQKSYESALKENVSLQKELEEMRNSFDQLVEQLSNKESEQIEVLLFQSKLHKEDYESEKRDKELAVKELKRVNIENDMLTKICKKYEKKLQNFVEVFRNRDLLKNKNDLKQSSSLTIIGMNEEKVKTNSNSLPNDFRIKTNKSKDIKHKSQTDLEDMIECPNCRTLFSIQLFEQLLEHFEKCQSIN